MSEVDLMGLAAEIERTAAEVEHKQLTEVAATTGAGTEDREVIQRRYQGCAQPFFEPFTRIPDPVSYDEAIESLHSAMGDLSQGAHFTDPINKKTVDANPDMQAIETAADELNDWTGAAGDAFKANFLDPFPAVATNQFLILGIMKGAAEADKAVWDRARVDIHSIANETLNALENVGSKGKNDFEFGLSVASAVVAVAGIPFTGGASAVVAGVGAAVMTAGAAAQGKEMIKSSGGSAEQVVRSMQTAIDKLTEQIRAKQEQIARTLNGYAAQVQQHKGQANSSFVSKRPKLADMDGKKLTGRQGLGDYG